MLLEDLINRFKAVKKRSPLHVNELLDYIQNRYICNEITIVEYKHLFSKLHQCSAEKPQSYFIKLKSLEEINIPS
jgi:hypothetical protein